MPVFHKGRVYVTAGGDLWHGKLKAWLKCIDASKQGDITKTGEVWSYPLERHCMSTPSVEDGLVYIADCGRKVHCVDAETGRAHWTHKANGEVWGSTLAADGKVYVGSQRGDFWVLAAGKELRVLGSIDMDSAVSASPAAANGVLYVGTMTRLYAVKKSQ
jgi:outer membrane protein assembly factor BamB